MKKRLLYLFMLISSVSLFMSCSDDDDVKYPVDSELAGAYKGTMDVYYVGVSTPIASDMVQKVYISKASDTAVKLELRNFTITVAGTELLIGDITVDNCALTKSGDAYKFSGNQTLSLVVGSCNTSVSGTVGKNAVDMVIDDAKSTITFKVNDEATEEELKALVPAIAISEKATVTPASGVAQDFSGGKSVVYTVVAEDGTSRKYTASIEGVQNIMKYSLDEWSEFDAGNSYENYWTPEPAGFLATSNGGAKMLNGSSSAVKVGYPVMEESEGFSGKAAKLVTLDSRAHALGSMAPITSGSLFTGTFSLNMLAPLKSTKFGIAYDKEPKLLKGVYKYKAGTNYIDGSVKPAQEGLNIIDECSIAAVLYEAKDAAGKDVTLTGVDINTSEYRVAEARLKDGTDKDEWTTFELAFEYLPEKSYDSTKEYKLAIICSSSKEGDKFKGAANSTLIVDELEVIGE